MTKISNVRKTTKFKRSLKAISPVIATLLMIAIAVVASLVVYAWVTGYIGGTTSTAGKSIQIQSFAPQGSNLLIYVQNVGQGDVQLNKAGSVYVDDNLVSISNPTQSQIPITVGQTVELTVPLPAGYAQGDNIKIKVTTSDGTFMTTSGTGTSSNNPTAPPGAVATKLVFSAGAPQSLTVGVVSPTAIVIQRQDASGAAVSTGTSLIAVGLSTSGTGLFYSDAAGTTAITSINIAAGSSDSAGFYYKATAVGTGTNTLTGASGTLTSATSAFTINAVTQYTITFASLGLAGDGSGNLVTYTVNGGTPTSIGVAGGSITVNAGDNIHYAFQSPITSSGSPSTTRYLWSLTSGLSQTLQTNTFTASATGTITATYTKQTFGIDSSGSNTATSGTTITVSSLNCPVGDVIIVIARTHGGSTPVTVSSISSTSSQTWHLSRGLVSGVSSHAYLSESYAVVTGSAVTSVTVTFSGTLGSSETGDVIVFSISGASATPFDTHAGLPYTSSSSGTSAPSVTGVSTSNAHDMIIGLEGSRATTTETAGTISSPSTALSLIKFQVAGTDGGAAAEDGIVSSTLSSATVNFGTSIANDWVAIVDAVQRAW